MGKLTATFLVIFLSCLCLEVLAQDAPGGKISIQAGISIYPNPATGPQVYVEFPFSLNRNQFLFLPVDSLSVEVRAAIFAEIIITDTLGRHIDSASTYFYTKASDSIVARIEKIRLFNKLFLMLPPGIYKGRLDVVDVSSKNEATFLYERMEIPTITTEKINLSTLELAHDIMILESDMISGNPRMVKNEREIVPSPMGIFAQDDSLLYVYGEIYNLPYDSSGSDKFKINYRVFRNDGSLRYDFGDILDEKPGPSAVITSVLNIKGWEPGRYQLDLTATDIKSNISAITSKNFLIFPKAGYSGAIMGSHASNPLDTAGIATISNILRFLISSQDAALYAGLNDSGKIRFAKQFFGDHDPSPGTPANEYMESAFQRYNYGIDHFSSLPGQRDGWRTDRGRVLMQYGNWDEREEITAPAYGLPWERWYYRAIQGGVLFIFQDINGYGEFKLVHSTAKGEIFNNDWNTRVKEEHLDTY